MIVGVPAETKKDEYRTAMLPVGAHLLVTDNHTVLIEKGAGLGSGYEDVAYTEAGATIVESAAQVFSESDLVVKVKEPQKEEIQMLRGQQTVFCYFHFAGSRELTEGCLEKEISAAGGLIPYLNKELDG